MTQSYLGEITTLGPHLLSALSCLYLFYSYPKILKKTVGLKMILILSLSDFSLHIGYILSYAFSI